MNIAAWLRSLGLERYEAAFRDNEIDGTVLPSLTAEDLKDLGVTIVGHRRKLLDAIAALRADASEKSRPADAVPVTDRTAKDTAERRQVTVMFSDLVGSTALAVRMDPEDLREIISAYQKCVAETVQRYDGFVARYMGDGVLVHFGYPRAHEDDAERAVRAGIELVTAVAALKSPAPLQTRIGIATGLVVVGELIGSGDTQERAIVGKTPNLAARLQGVAKPNMVVICDSTRRLLGNLFELEGLGLRDLKGITEPTRAWAALRASSAEGRFDAMHASGLTALVGREEESELLRRRWSKAKSGEGQVLLLSGEAGIGKSRLTAGLLERLAGEPHTRLRYFCSRQHTDSALHPIIGQMERAAGLMHNDTAQAKLDKLDALLAPTSTLKQDAALIAELLSLANDGRYPALDLAPEQRRQRTLEALIAQTETLARQNPVLMIFEDAHWTDPTSLELFGRAVHRIVSLRVLLIVTFRPEFAPPWIGLPHVTALTLNRLAERDAGAIIDRIISSKFIPANIRQDIIERTDGIPLFVEEMTKAVIEAESERVAERAAAAVPSPALAVPASLHASLMARLDRLGPAKEVAQIGAAIGREFLYPVLAAVTRLPEAELGSALDRLVAAGLLFRQGVPPHVSYLFKHALVQDAAYESLLRTKRQQLHNRIANVFKEQFTDIIEQQPELMAHHLLQAGLIEPAIGYLQRAGQRAIQRSANTEAIGHLKQALELLHSLPKGRERACTELETEVMLGQAMIAGRGYAAQETKEVLLRTRNLIDESTASEQKFAILYGIWACYYVGGEGEMICAAAQDFLSEAKHHDDSAALCLAHRTLGTTRVTMGDFVSGRWHLERARELYDPANHTRLRYQYGQDIGAAALCYLCWALWHLGYVDQAASVSTEAMAIAEASSHPHTLAYTICHALGMLDVCRRRTEDMQSYAKVAVMVSKDHGFPFWAAGGRILEGWAVTCQGQAHRGIELLEEGLSAWRATGAKLWLPIFLALKAQAQAKGGYGEIALQTIEQAITVSNETNERWAIAEVLRLKADLLLACGLATPNEIEELLVDSLGIARTQKARSWELRTACDLACLWQGQGRWNEAASLLQASYGQFTEGFESPDLKCARMHLDRCLAQ